MIKPTLVAVLVAAVAGLCSPAGADDAAPAQEGSVKKAFRKMGRDIRGAGRQLGHEFVEFGKGVGKGTANAAKANAGKVSSDVKQGNFKPVNNSEATKRRDPAEAGGAAPPPAEGRPVKSSGGAAVQAAKP